MKDNAKMQMLDAWRDYNEQARQLCKAYFAMKYDATQDAIAILKSAELSGLDEKLAAHLIEAIKKEMKK